MLAFAVDLLVSVFRRRPWPRLVPCSRFLTTLVRGRTRCGPLCRHQHSRCLPRKSVIACARNAGSDILSSTYLQQYCPEDDDGSLPNRLKGNGLAVI